MVVWVQSIDGLEKSVVFLVHVTIPCSILFSAVPKCINTIQKAKQRDTKGEARNQQQKKKRKKKRPKSGKGKSETEKENERKYQKSIHRIYTESAAQKRYNLSDDGNKLRLGRSFFFYHIHSMYGNVRNRRQNPMIETNKRKTVYKSTWTYIHIMFSSAHSFLVLSCVLSSLCRWLQKPISPSHAYQYLQNEKYKTIL